MKNKPLIIAGCCMLPLLLAQDEFILNAFGFGQDDITISTAETVYSPVMANADPGLDLNDSGSVVFDGLVSKLVLGEPPLDVPPLDTSMGPDGDDLSTDGPFPEMFLQSPFKSSSASLTADIAARSSPGYLPSFNGGGSYFQSLPAKAPGLQAGGNSHFDSNTASEEQTGDVDSSPPLFPQDPESIYTPPSLPPGFFDVVQIPTTPAGPNTDTQVAAVPEPGIALLFVLALVGLAIGRKQLVAEG